MAARNGGSHPSVQTAEVEPGCGARFACAQHDREGEGIGTELPDNTNQVETSSAGDPRRVHSEGPCFLLVRPDALQSPDLRRGRTDREGQRPEGLRFPVTKPGIRRSSSGRGTSACPGFRGGRRSSSATLGLGQGPGSGLHPTVARTIQVAPTSRWCRRRRRPAARGGNPTRE